MHTSAANAFMTDQTNVYLKYLPRIFALFSLGYLFEKAGYKALPSPRSYTFIIVALCVFTYHIMKNIHIFILMIYKYKIKLKLVSITVVTN